MNTENGNGLVPVASFNEAPCLNTCIALLPSGPQTTGPASPIADGASNKTREGAQNYCARAGSTYRWWVNLLSQYTNAGPPQPVRPPIDLVETPSLTTPSAARRATTPTGASRAKSYPGLAATPGASGAGALAHRPVRMGVSA